MHIYDQLLPDCVVVTRGPMNIPQLQRIRIVPLPRRPASLSTHHKILRRDVVRRDLPADKAPTE